VSYILLPGKTAQLTAVVTPANANMKNVRWESTNPSVVSVDAKGKIKAHALGSATIYAYATDGSGVYGYCSIYVRNPVRKISLKAMQNNQECTDNVVALYGPEWHSSFTVQSVVFDKDGYSDSNHVYGGLEWKISGNGAKNACVFSNTVYYTNPGTITVTATALDGSRKKASMKVKVEQHVYQLEAKAPKNVYAFTNAEETYWQMGIPSKDTTLTPVMKYNVGGAAPDAKWKKYEIILSDEAKEVMQVNKKGTGIVIAKGATPGDYEVTFKSLDDTRNVTDSVIIRISDSVSDAKIIWPSNVTPTGQTQMLAEGSKLSLSASVNGKVKNASYQYTWSLEGDEANEGAALISSKGVLDLTKAKAGDGYSLNLSISKAGEEVSSVTQGIWVTAKPDKENVKLMLSGIDEEFPSETTPVYAAKGKGVRAAISQNPAFLYQLSGGKKGVLRIEESVNGYMLYTDGVGTAKVTVKAMDGSNFKKDFTIKVVKPEEAVAQFIVPKGTISLSGKQPEYIQYKLLTKEGEVPTDCRIKWEISDRNKVFFLTEGPNVKEMITNQASGTVPIMGNNATLRNVTLKGTTLDGSNKKVTVKIKVDDWFKVMMSNSVFAVYPQNTARYMEETRKPLLIHGKSMKFDVHCNYIGYSKNRLTYEYAGYAEDGTIINADEMKKLGVTFKNGVLKVAANSTYSGKVLVKVGYTKPSNIEPSEWRTCEVQIKAPVTKVSIQNTAGEAVSKVTAAPGESIAFKANVTGKKEDSPIYQGVTWTVSDKKYASVTKDGVVTIAANAPKKKAIKVIATAADGSKKKGVVTITVK